MDQRSFALKVTRQLQDAGYVAYWAGGCVRDALLNLAPKDYDVATNASPDQVRDLFGHHRTLAIGISFGVISVLGPRSLDPIEVATFRRDAHYSDGRRPDHVEYTTPEEDAERRDFTINGMFYDPVREIVIDFVGGELDLEAGIVRAIGDPHERIREDKLRMLRAIRFATTFSFALDPVTLDAIRQHAPEIGVVSPERIGIEIRKTLAHPGRATGARLLRESRLLQHVVPEGDVLLTKPDRWKATLAGLERLAVPDFIPAAVILLRPLLESVGVDTVYRAWRLTNDERKSLVWIVAHLPHLRHAADLAWSKLQPILAHPDARWGVEVLASEGEPTARAVSVCREKMSLPPEQLDPPPLIGGRELIEMGLRPGAAFSQILSRIRAGQLDGEIATTAEAIERARALIEAPDIGEHSPND